MIRKALLQIIIGVSIVLILVVMLPILGSLRPISDDQIDAQIMGASVLVNAQYVEIREHFPEETRTIRDEAKRHERMRRRGRIVHIGNLVAFMRNLMAPKYRAVASAPENALDASLKAVLNSYAVLEGTPDCGRFLVNGTIVLPVDLRQRLWNSQAADMPLHFDTIVQGISDPHTHADPTDQSWMTLYDLYLANGGTEARVATYGQTFGGNPNRQHANPTEICAAFLGIGRTLVGARFPGSAIIKANLIILSFGVPAKA